MIVSQPTEKPIPPLDYKNTLRKSYPTKKETARKILKISLLSLVLLLLGDCLFVGVCAYFSPMNMRYPPPRE